MAKRKVKQTDAVQVAQSQPADAESKVKADSELSQSQSADDEAKVKGNPDPSQSQSVDDEAKADTAPQETTRYMITCRNTVSKEIGGVTFVKGVGYTEDGFTASWFSNKCGYNVSKV